jgi:hypothetical protein
VTAVLDGPTATGPTLQSEYRRFRGPVLLVAALVAAAGVGGLLSLAGPSGYLDPDAYDPRGSRAVAELLRDGGVAVDRVSTVEQALAADGEATVLVVPRPEGLAQSELEQLTARTGPLVLVQPADDDLEALDLPAEVGGSAPVEGRRPACDYGPAQRAGVTDLGGVLYAPTGDGATGCYAVRRTASLLVLPEQRAVVLGSGDLLTNERLDERGNAALALGLLAQGDRVAWLVPDPAREVPASEQRPLVELLPDALKLGVVQAGLAVGVLALWRARRLGRVVEEPLPVVVRAAEAVEGRGRLYRAAGARETAGEALRAAVRDRLRHRLGLPPSVGREALVERASARAAREAAGVDVLLYGAPPADDAALVRLRDALQELETAVLSPPAPTPQPPTSEQEVAGP